MRNRLLRPILSAAACLVILAAFGVSCGSAAVQPPPDTVVRHRCYQSLYGRSMCVAFIRAANNVRNANNPRPDTATPLNGTGVSLGVQTFLSAWAEYDPSDCTEVTSGTWTLNSSPAYGTVSTGTITGPSGCNGGTFTYGAIYYTLTSATAMTDSFSATWNGDGRTSPEGGTFSLVAFDLAKNNGDCGCNTA